MTTEYLSRDELLPAVASRLRPARTVLDIGPGIHPQEFVRAETYVWCEPFGPYVEALRERLGGASNVVLVQATGQALLPLLPDKSVDTIFLVDVLEHLGRDDGRQLLDQCERTARTQIVVFTPLGFMPQDYEPGDTDAWGMNGGEWQSHRSGWTPDDLGGQWDTLICTDYHTHNGKGETFESGFGAFWAIRNLAALGAKTRMAILCDRLAPDEALFAPMQQLAADESYLISSVTDGRYHSEYLASSEPQAALPYAFRKIQRRPLAENYLEAQYADDIHALTLAVFEKMATMPAVQTFELIQIAAVWLQEQRSLFPTLDTVAETVNRVIASFNETDPSIVTDAQQADPALYTILTRLLRLQRESASIGADLVTAKELLAALHEETRTLYVLSENIGLVCMRLLEIHSRAAQMTAILRDDPPVVLLAVIADPLDLPAAYLASRWTHLPLICCMEQAYTELWEASALSLAQAFENMMLPECRSVWFKTRDLLTAYAPRLTHVPIYVYEEADLAHALANGANP